MEIDNEGYQPSKEEIQRAEESMTEKQIRGTEIRQSIENFGLKSQEIEQIMRLERIDEKDGTDGFDIESGFRGMLNGHSIYLKGFREVGKDWEYEGTIDGLELPVDEVVRLLSMYGKVHSVENQSDAEGKEAKDEITAINLLNDIPGGKSIE